MIIDWLDRALFPRLLGTTRWLTATERRNKIGRHFMRLMGALTLVLKRGKPKRGVRAIAEEWQRMFPTKKMVPLMRVDDGADGAVYAEIHTHCPYRGSGNVEGCHRMMEYDRRLLERLGGEFVVLRSQAESGVEHCLVAISASREAARGFVHAQDRVRDGGPPPETPR